MDAIIFLVGLAVTIIIGGIFFILGHTPKEQHTSDKKIRGIDFTPSQMFMGSDGLGGLAVNERTQQICLLKSPSSSPRLFPITDLIGSYLIKNGEILGEGKRRHPKDIVTFSNELHRKKNVLITSLHMGSSQGSNQRIDLLLVVHDQDDPIHIVNFLDMEIKEGGILFEKAMSTATHWHDVLDGLILQADQLARLQSEMPQEKEMAEAAP